MTHSFDPYHRWLGIRPEEQPADHYRLLGLARFEDDPEVIRDAAERQIRHVRSYQLGQHRQLSQKILNELAAAKASLLDDGKRAEFNERLRQELAVEKKRRPPALPSRVKSSVASTTGAPSLPIKVDRPAVSSRTRSHVSAGRRPAGLLNRWRSPTGIGAAVAVGLGALVLLLWLVARWSAEDGDRDIAGAYVTPPTSRLGSVNGDEGSTSAPGENVTPGRKVPVSHRTSSRVTDSAAGKPKPPDESPLREEVPFTEAMQAITNGKIEQARPLLERVLVSPDTQQRNWARQMLEEADIATSDYAAQELLEQQLSDERLELFVEGKLEVDAPSYFSYPALDERFRQTLKKNAPAVLERRRANRAENKAAAAPPTDPAEFLESRGLRKQGEFWLLEDDDELRESVTQVDGLARSSRAADTAVLKGVDTIREADNQLAVAEQGVRIGIIEEAQRKLDNAKREYREVLAKSMKARNQLAVASLQAARRAEETMAKYQELADDPNVRKALEGLGPETDRLGPTPVLERNLKRIQKNDNRLLTDQVMGFYGGEEEDVFHVEAILNDRATALFAIRPRAEFSLVPEHVLREAGIPYDAEWKVEQKANGIEFRTNPVVIPSLRLGKFVSTNIEAFVLPAEVRDLNGFLANNAFPNFRIEFRPGESVARLRAVR